MCRNAMTRFLPPINYHTRTTSWPLTSYTHATTRFLPPTPIEELV